ncbi:hypothetical protein CON07_23370 [Bacillus sp. AFS094611]|uniref:hypothetical protein n=1 Tax=Bacillus sp. AFS094611 TaxID=2033516 RepID=UPI000BED5D1E|nr:hypothetical protein [Bacillus sp. AFS094611]PDZ49174.1 hypothetical protein CON07_23370 [Bacillus sp. AFS094611]
MFKNWSNRDWIWTVSFLILIIIVLIADFFNFPNIEANFNIIASAVSIALAIVAISFAFKQDSDNKRDSARLVDLLNGIHVDVKDVGSKLDPKEIDNLTNESVKDASETFEKKESYSKEEVDRMISEIRKNISANINEHLAQNKEDNKINKRSRENTAKMLYIIRNVIKKNYLKSNAEIVKLLNDDYGIRTSEDTIDQVREDII